jgi:hypothetical protein
MSNINKVIIDIKENLDEAMKHNLDDEKHKEKMIKCLNIFNKNLDLLKQKELSIYHINFSRTRLIRIIDELLLLHKTKKTTQNESKEKEISKDDKLNLKRDKMYQLIDQILIDIKLIKDQNIVQGKLLDGLEILKEYGNDFEKFIVTTPCMNIGGTFKLDHNLAISILTDFIINENKEMLNINKNDEIKNERINKYDRAISMFELVNKKVEEDNIILAYDNIEVDHKDDLENTEDFVIENDPLYQKYPELFENEKKDRKRKEKIGEKYLKRINGELENETKNIIIIEKNIKKVKSMRKKKKKNVFV